MSGRPETVSGVPSATGQRIHNPLIRLRNLLFRELQCQPNSMKYRSATSAAPAPIATKRRACSDRTLRAPAIRRRDPTVQHRPPCAIRAQTAATRTPVLSSTSGSKSPAPSRAARSPGPVCEPGGVTRRSPPSGRPLTDTDQPLIDVRTSQLFNERTSGKKLTGRARCVLSLGGESESGSHSAPRPAASSDPNCRSQPALPTTNPPPLDLPLLALRIRLGFSRLNRASALWRTDQA
jgi:hypothetical protein